MLPNDDGGGDLARDYVARKYNTDRVIIMSETKNTWNELKILMREGKTVTCPFCGQKSMRSEGYGFRCDSCKKGIMGRQPIDLKSILKN